MKSYLNNTLFTTAVLVEILKNLMLTAADKWNYIVANEDLLNTKVELKYFVPCTDDNKPLSTPKNYSVYCTNKGDKKIEALDLFDTVECMKYTEALADVLFEGYTCKLMYNYYLVEDSKKELIWGTWKNSIFRDILISEVIKAPQILKLKDQSWVY